jgi:hypothetical protein
MLADSSGVGVAKRSLNHRQIEHNIQKDPFVRHLGARVVIHAPGHCTVILTIGERRLCPSQKVLVCSARSNARCVTVNRGRRWMRQGPSENRVYHPFCLPFERIRRLGRKKAVEIDDLFGDTYEMTWAGS